MLTSSRLDETTILSGLKISLPLQFTAHVIITHDLVIKSFHLPPLTAAHQRTEPHHKLVAPAPIRRAASYHQRKAVPRTPRTACCPTTRGGPSSCGTVHLSRDPLAAQSDTCYHQSSAPESCSTSMEFRSWYRCPWYHAATLCASRNRYLDCSSRRWGNGMRWRRMALCCRLNHCECVQPQPGPPASDIR